MTMCAVNPGQTLCSLTETCTARAIPVLYKRSHTYGQSLSYMQRHEDIPGAMNVVRDIPNIYESIVLRVRAHCHKIGHLTHTN